MREREREEGEKQASFSEDFTRFCRSELGKPRVEVALRDESYMWVPESENFAKVQGSGFHGNQVSREITLFEVGFFSFSV